MQDEICWDFVSSHMAPLSLGNDPTYGQIADTDADPEQVINDLIAHIASEVHLVPKCEVCS